MRTYVKFIVIIVVMFIPMYGMFRWYQYATTKNPLPTTSAETVRAFFTALQQKPDGDFFRCRQLLSMQAKTPILIDQNTQQNINDHFDRVRNYLLQRVGADFASHIRLLPGSLEYSTVSFNDEIILRCFMKTQWGYDEKTHYTLESILEFPLDLMPKLGVEKRIRALRRLMESEDGLDLEYEEIDNAAEVIKIQPGEPPSRRLQRLVDGFDHALQLDVRHAILDAVRAEFPDAPDTRNLLREIAEDKSEALHLQKLAQKILDDKRNLPLM